MNQQTLKTVISIGGNVDNSFGQIGSALLGLGNQIDQVSQKAIEFGSESLDKFVDYDDLMRETKALGEFTNAEIKALDEINRKIPRTTIYLRQQAAEAEVFMGQLGLSTREIGSLLPDVLELAAAGKLKLSDSVKYLYSTIKSLDLELGDSDVLTDQMAKTAALGATDIDTLGDAMTRLGSGMKLFKGGAPEVLTILSAMSDFGEDMRGTEGGTALRNFALSLIAPAGENKAVTAALENLGISNDDLTAYLDSEGIDVTNAAAAIKGLGLEAFDANGNLRNMLDIISDLRTSTGKLDEKLRTQTLRQIFGKRGYVTAENLLRVTDSEYQMEYAQIIGSKGYAAQMAETMQGGIGGSLRRLEAIYDEFQTTVGGALAPTIDKGADWLHSIVTDLADMDEDKLDALISGIGTIAVAGPALVTTGLAFRLIGYALTPAGGIGLGLIALAAAASAMQKLKEADMAANFGDMDLDTETLSAYVKSLGDDFKASYTEINGFTTALDDAVTKYESASQTFSSNILTAMLTSATLTDADKANLQNLGVEMYTQLTTGISNATAATMSYWQMLFGGEGTAEYDPEYQDIIDITNQSYLDMMTNAQTISDGLRDALTSAFDDGIISPEEYAELRKWFTAYNDAMAQAAAEAQKEDDYVNYQKMLHKAQTASYDDIKSFSGEIEKERNDRLAKAEEEYLTERFKLEYRWNQYIANGTMIDGELATEEQKKKALIDADEKYKTHKSQILADSDGLLLKLWGSSIDQSDLGDSYDLLGRYADTYLAGGITQESANDILGSLFGKSKYAGDTVFAWENPIRQQLGEYLARIIASLGSYDGIKDKMDYYTSIGDGAKADELARILAMEGLVNNFTRTSVAGDGKLLGIWGAEGQVFGMPGMYNPSNEYLDGFMRDYTTETAKSTIAAFNSNGNMGDAWASIGDMLAKHNASLMGNYTMSSTYLGENTKREMDVIVSRLAETYDFEKVLKGLDFVPEDKAAANYAAAYSLLYGNASQNPDQYRIGIDVLTSSGTTDGQKWKADFEAAASPYVSVRTGTVGPGSVDWSKLKGYADGGRASEASIFGEAGAEWAIPEEHSSRTAELINAARQASGFTWPELIGRNGGLNASPNRMPSQIVYSPTIYANDATGVEAKLITDKERFTKLLEERQMRDEAEVYQ